MSVSLPMDLYDTDPDRFRREVAALRDRAILPPPSYPADRTVSGSLQFAHKPHRVTVDAEFLLGLIVLVEQQMEADGRQPLGPGPYREAAR